MGGGAGHHLFAQRGIRAGVAVQLGLDRGQAAVAAGAHLDPDLGGMPLGMDDQAFLAVVEQLDRPAGDIGQQAAWICPAMSSLPPNPPPISWPMMCTCSSGQPSARATWFAVLVGDLRADVDFHAPIRRQAGDAAFRLHKGVVVDRGVEGVLEDHIRVRQSPAPCRPCAP